MVDEGVGPSRPRGHRFLRPGRLPFRQPTTKQCRQPESNWHAHASTAPSTLRVCHSPMTACSQLSHHGNSNPALLLTEQACRRLHLSGIGIPGRIRTCMSRLRRLSPVPIWTGTSSWQRDLNSQSSAYRAAALHCAMPGNCGSYENRTRLSTVTGWRRQPIDQGAIVGAGRIELPSEACRASVASTRRCSGGNSRLCPCRLQLVELALS